MIRTRRAKDIRANEGLERELDHTDRVAARAERIAAIRVARLNKED
jgi:hypothetical protein